MSRRQNRRAVRWARHFNRYAHIPGVLVGGNAAFRVMWGSWRPGPFRSVRRQTKHRYGEGRSS